MHRSAVHQRLANALPFVAHGPGTGCGQREVLNQIALVRAGNHDGHLQGQQVVQANAFQQMQAEVCAHTGAQHLGTPQRRRAFEGHHLLEAKSPSAAQNRTDVARVLHPVQDDGGNVWLQGCV